MDEYYYIEELKDEIDYLAEENERLKQELTHYKKLIDIIFNKGE